MDTATQPKHQTCLRLTNADGVRPSRPQKDEEFDGLGEFLNRRRYGAFCARGRAHTANVTGALVCMVLSTVVANLHSAELPPLPPPTRGATESKPRFEDFADSD